MSVHGHVIVGCPERSDIVFGFVMQSEYYRCAAVGDLLSNATQSGVMVAARHLTPGRYIGTGSGDLPGVHEPVTRSDEASFALAKKVRSWPYLVDANKIELATEDAFLGTYVEPIDMAIGAAEPRTTRGHQ
jgi:hypothetical protein